MLQPLQPVQWQDNTLLLLDQRLLPQQENYLRIDTAGELARAIHDMVVRGAPAIGVAAAYGCVLAAREALAQAPQAWRDAWEPHLTQLQNARPTAVNLQWAITRMRTCASTLTTDPLAGLLAAAQRIHQDDIAANQKMGALGAMLLPPGARVLTHCNAGALATGGYGTALGVIRSAHAAGKLAAVYATETRPWRQGARLTMWELQRDGINSTLVADTAVAHLLASRGVDWIIVGADRIAANGDTANKIGTYQLALLAHAHGAKLMVAAPMSTLDYTLASGAQIPIEERSGEELLRAGESRLPDWPVWNPVFDVTPARLIDAIVTENGVVNAPDNARLQALKTPAK